MAFGLESGEPSSGESSRRQVRFGNVEKFEYFIGAEKEMTTRKKIQKFLEKLDLKIKNDEQLKILIKNQIF